MGEFKGTKGPWKHWGGRRGTMGQPEETMQKYFSVRQNIRGEKNNGMDATVCNVEIGEVTHDFKGGKYERITFEVAEANAQLIAAAPELLAACKAFIDLFTESDMRPEDECHELYAVIKSAYNKALGEVKPC